MKTAVTIPWGAVVEGCPPSRQANGAARHDSLPLVFAERWCERGWLPSFAGLKRDIACALAELGPESLAIANRETGSTLIEVPLHQVGVVVLLTSDRSSAVVVQAGYVPTASPAACGSEIQRDEDARRYVARYATFDADARVFTHWVGEGEMKWPYMEFVNADKWGFDRGTSHWTGVGLFDAPPPAMTMKRPPTATRPRPEDPFREATPDRGDPFRCLPQLTQLLRLSELRTEAKPANVAYFLAVALGRCRLFGVAAGPGEEVVLAPATFEEAATILQEHVKHVVVEHSEEKLERFGGHVRRNVALDLLEARMDAHAAYLALDEAYAAALYDGSPEAPAMSRRLSQVRRLINVLDSNLQKNLSLLRLAASTYLLDNWRRLLAPTYRDCPPWWLDGCIG
jgi:hypothetical protein